MDQGCSLHGREEWGGLSGPGVPFEVTSQGPHFFPSGHLAYRFHSLPVASQTGDHTCAAEALGWGGALQVETMAAALGTWVHCCDSFAPISNTGAPWAGAFVSGVLLTIAQLHSHGVPEAEV